MKSATTIWSAEVSDLPTAKWSCCALPSSRVQTGSNLLCLFNFPRQGDRRLSYKALQGALMIYFYRFVASLRRRHFLPRLALKETREQTNVSDTPATTSETQSSMLLGRNPGSRCHSSCSRPSWILTPS